MPSEKQIEAACRVHNVGWSLWKEPQKKTAREVMRLTLTAAEQAQEAQPVVKVKELEWESVDGGNAFRAPALIFGWIRIETYTLHSWQVQWSVPGICNLLMPNVFDCPSAAKAAAQADFEQRILAALETAEQAQEAQPVVSNKAAEGGQAYKRGMTRDQNPYPKGTARYWQWSSGWLDEQAFRPTIPEGWKIVPIEPTGKMIHAGLNAIPYAIDEPDGAVADRLIMREEYRAMLAAAPKTDDNK